MAILTNGLADVKPGDLVGAELGEFDRQKSGPGGNLKDLRACGQAICDHPRSAAEILDIACGILGVPIGDEAFHSDAPIGL